VGYSPRLVVGVWVGHDERQSLGEQETGARAALPLWIEFMRRALAGAADQAFPVPPGIVRVALDLETGRRPAAGAPCSAQGFEVFLAGTEPTERCSPGQHARRRLPYPLQRYPLDESGALVIPALELRELLAAEPEAAYDPRSGEIEIWGPAGHLRVRVAPAADAGGGERAEDVRAGAAWTGLDGRPARVVRLREPG
jgi:membrane peptidoglycan carboxypeptidase